MELQAVITLVLVGVLYPMWLVAGLVDYWCHKLTDIEATSGRIESWFHVAQFASLGVALLALALFVVTPASMLVLVAAVITHTVLAFIDVTYTTGRRYISPLEQHVHGYLDVLPVVAAFLILALHWNELRNSSWHLQLRDPSAMRQWSLLLATYFVLVGGPVFVELRRTLKRNRDRMPVMSDIG
jgi:4-hydroxybenzoate polyprenyltransferase